MEARERERRGGQPSSSFSRLSVSLVCLSVSLSLCLSFSVSVSHLHGEFEEVVRRFDVVLSKPQHRRQLADLLAPIGDGRFPRLLREHVPVAVRRPAGTGAARRYELTDDVTWRVSGEVCVSVGVGVGVCVERKCAWRWKRWEGVCAGRGAKDACAACVRACMYMRVRACVQSTR